MRHSDALCDTLSHLQGPLHYYYMIQTDCMGRERVKKRAREMFAKQILSIHHLGCVPSALPILSLQIIPVDIFNKQTKQSLSKESIYISSFRKLKKYLLKLVRLSKIDCVIYCLVFRSCCNLNKFKFADWLNAPCIQNRNQYIQL